VTRLAFSKVPRGGKVEVRCRGGGCPFRTRVVALRANGTADATRAFARRRLRPGTVVEARISASGFTGKVVRFTIRRSRSPRTALLCLPPGAFAPRACA